MKIAIGPCLFEWGKRAVRQFYQRMAFETEADILYIGEVVCSKRSHLHAEELAQLAEELLPSGKQIIFSTLGLVMNEGEQSALRQIAAEARRLGVWLEVNDMGGMGIAEGQPMVAGPHINTYNAETVAFLARVGVKRVVLPVELAHSAMRCIMTGTAAPEMEVFAYGRLPLTFSARCYTARAFHLPKSNCQYKCGDFPDGMEVRTQEDDSFLTVNGVQTMSARLYNLLADLPILRNMAVDVLRLSPQSQAMPEIVALWKQALDGRMDGQEALQRLRELNAHEAFCNGYFHGRPGLQWIDSAA
ncbi:U32 family peptidase [Candidatus Magnetaquicoccus inordinatus]|uniref:U32 family peptidase n=1 Tax=Candidatus Magnetaquicoccus inordinatus TaxID=2496818 RepID=UPI00187D691E|nr:U32 family peptidase [Candidatus Magnetaquicoccus inordinatus]